MAGRPKKIIAPVWVTTVEAATLLGVSRWWLLKNREIFPKKTWKILNPFAQRVSYRWNKSELLDFWQKSERA